MQRKRTKCDFPSRFNHFYSICLSLVEPYHCKGKFLEDFDALCRQAQITYIVPVVPRPRVSGTVGGVASAADTKDKAATKTSKIAANKEREAAAHQHAELESGDTLAGG